MPKHDTSEGRIDWDWDDFRVFVAIARQGSYTRAARELGWTQSAVSRRIARLEQTLGLRLFDRSFRGAQLTSEGEKLLGYANGAELMLSRGVDSVRDAARRVESDCSLVMGDGLASYWMPLFLPDLLLRNPALQLKLYTGHEQHADGQKLFDLEVQYARPLAPDLVAVQLGTLHFMLFATEDYVMRFGVPHSWRDLRHHRIADTAFRLSDRGSFASWAGLDHAATVATNSSTVLGETVRSGACVGLLATYATVVDPRLVPLMPELHYQAPVYVCFERSVGKKPGVRATIDFLKEAVFDGRAMPWFAEDFSSPSKHWPDLLADHLSNIRAAHARPKLKTVR